MGMHVLACDPPRQRVEGNADFVSWPEILKQADVLTLHTPMIRSGNDTTYHLMNEETFSAFQGYGIINAARGSCIDEVALMRWLNANTRRWVVLDCWEHEPDILPDLLHHPQLAIATPHIAGHSLDGKAANTQYIYDALCHYLQAQKNWHAITALPNIVMPLLHVSDPVQAIQSLYPIMADDDALHHKQAFTHQRRNYPIRRAWEYYTVALAPHEEKNQALANAFVAMSKRYQWKPSS